MKTTIPVLILCLVVAAGCSKVNYVEYEAVKAQNADLVAKMSNFERSIEEAKQQQAKEEQQKAEAARTAELATIKSQLDKAQQAFALASNYVITTRSELAKRDAIIADLRQTIATGGNVVRSQPQPRAAATAIRPSGLAGPQYHGGVRGRGPNGEPTWGTPSAERLK